MTNILNSNNGKSSTVKEISEALKITERDKKRINLYDILDVHEICDGLYLSSSALPNDLAQLRKLRITHILNVAEGTSFAHCNTGPFFYRGFKFTYKGLAANDLPSYDLSQHFEEAFRFIDSAIKSGGKVLVHCLQGISRSPTIVAAYLIKGNNMSASEAIRTVRSKREIHPNSGFIRQLVDYDKELHEEQLDLF